MNNFKTITEWYNTASVKFEIIKFLRNREMALLVPSWIKDKETRIRCIRMLKCHSVQHYDYILNKGLRIFEKQTPYNFYYSLAKYKDGIPNQTFNLWEKKKNNLSWNEIHFNRMVAYDFLIDIDAGSHEDIYFAFDSTKLIKAYFDMLNVPYELRFSGMGFHFIIPYLYLPYHSMIPKADSNLYWFLCLIAKKLKAKFSEMIDVNIYDSRRVCKIPYSLGIYENGLYVCYPFATSDEFEKFRLRDYVPSNFDVDIIRGKNRKVFNDCGSIYSLCKDLGVLNG